MKGKLLVFLAMLVLVAGMVSATDVDVSWEGSGSVIADIDADNDYESHFETVGKEIEGDYSAKDHNDNPYGYNVDTVESYVTSKSENGYAFYRAERTDSHESMYGDSGQVYYAEVVSDGNAEMAVGTNSNYASLKSSTYNKPKTTNGKNFELSGDNFLLRHGIRDGNENGAVIKLSGDGNAKVDSMSSEMHGSSYKFGKGAGCFKNADIKAEGSGHFVENAYADNKINTGDMVIDGDGSDDSASYKVNVDYGSGFTHDDFSLGGK